MRDDLCGYVVDALGEPDGVLIRTTRMIVKGQLTIGIRSQYTGTAGRIETAQVAVYWPTLRRADRR